jgi:hypothetical protein
LYEFPKSAWVTSAGIVTLAVSLGARHAAADATASVSSVLKPIAAIASWAGALLVIVGIGMMFFLES